jgi:hypothetical protein
MPLFERDFSDGCARIFEVSVNWLRWDRKESATHSTFGCHALLFGGSSGWAEAPGCESHRRCARRRVPFAVAFTGPFARGRPSGGSAVGQRMGGSPRLRVAPKVRAPPGAFAVAFTGPFAPRTAVRRLIMRADGRKPNGVDVLAYAASGSPLPRLGRGAGGEG